MLVTKKSIITNDFYVSTGPFINYVIQQCTYKADTTGYSDKVQRSLKQNRHTATKENFFFK